MTRDHDRDWRRSDTSETERAASPGIDSLFLDRRRLLRATGTLTVVATAGCSGGGDGGDGSCKPPADLSGPVPDVYRTATSEGGVSRKPGELISKEEADYQREPNGDQRCERCSYYIPDKNDDCAGACVRVEGPIDPTGYCEYYRTQVGGGW